MLNDNRIREIIEGLDGRRIAVIGDVMLDRYFRGSVTRISPEAPVPIVNVEDESEYPGGAANVGYNLATLGVQPLLLGVVGDDSTGEHLRGLLDDLGIGSQSIIVDAARPTTMKLRVMAGNHQIVRVDRETTGELAGATLERLMSALEENIRSLDAVILQDYNKGVVTRELITRSIALARENNVPVYVDPKHNNFFHYTDVTVFKPNRKEAEDALRSPLQTPGQRHDGIRELLERLRARYIILTLGPEGMMLAESGAEPILAPTRAMQVSDVSGAGDTVIATLAAACAAGATMFEAAMIANHAAGIVCGRSGTVPIGKDELCSDLIPA